MRFVDEARVFVRGGHGGRGCVSFLREKFRPRGGPNGGDGGNGGSVILVATTQAATLLDLQLNRHYRASSGEHGQGSDKHGANGSDIVIQVPLGTMVYNDESNELLGDLTSENDQIVVAEGGLGGRGNARFATAVRQAPRHAQPGLPGEEGWIRLELKLLADVGLVGFPNAGKSTLIRTLSRSRAKVADYPFTTLVPNLGVVTYESDRSFVIADVPGLIEGASDGAGLGHQFLRHIERTRVLIILLDVLGERTPRECYDILMAELEKHNPDLIDRSRLVCLNKCDLVDVETVELCREDLADAGVEDVLELSALQGDGMKVLKDQIVKQLEKDTPLY